MSSIAEVNQLFLQTDRNAIPQAIPGITIEVQDGEIYHADETYVIGSGGCLYTGEPSGWDGQRIRIKPVGEDSVEITQRKTVRELLDDPVIYKFKIPTKPPESSIEPVARNQFGRAIITSYSIEIVQEQKM